MPMSEYFVGEIIADIRKFVLFFYMYKKGHAGAQVAHIYLSEQPLSAVNDAESIRDKWTIKNNAE